MFDERVERALLVALDAHSKHVRKGSDEPYVVHPLHVALLLTQLGADFEVVQAGLLHDVVEDCEDWENSDLEREFGARVAALVAEVTEDKDLSWEERKQAQVDEVPSLSVGALSIKACDKLHNLETLALALRRAEDQTDVWSRFSGGRAATLTMSELLVEALALRVPDSLGRALRRALRTVREA